MGKIDLYQLLAELARAARQATLTLYQQAVEVTRRQRQATETVAQETAEVAQRARKVTERVLQEIAEVCWREASPQQTEKLFQLVAEICYLHCEVDMSKWRIVDVNGIERDLQSYFNFYVEEYRGMDSPEVQVFGTPYATLPGEVADGERVLARDMFLTGTLIAGSEQSLHRYRASLLDNLKPWRAGQTTWNSDTIRLRYVGQFRTIEINAKFLGDYGGTRRATDNCTQKLTLHFRAQEDVWWRGLTDVTTTLDATDTTSIYGVGGRIDGKWGAVGFPGGIIGDITIYAMAHDGTYLYVAGDFVDFYNYVGLNYIARWDGTTWSAVGPAGAGTGVVNALLLLPDGRLVVGGAFTNWDGNANGDYCVIYDPVTNTYAPMATGPSSEIRDIALNPLNGYIYVSKWDSVISYWDGAAWNNLAAFGAAAVINSLCFAPDGTLYAGGFADIMTFGTVFGMYDAGTATWTEYTGVEAGSVVAVRALTDGRVAIGGGFTTLGGVAVENVALWNGQRFAPMDAGLNDTVTRLFVNASDEVYALGEFTQIINPGRGITTASRMAVYHGGAWYRLDANFATDTTLYALAFDGDNIYFGGNISGTVTHSGDTDLTLTGVYTGATFPVFTICANPATEDPATLFFIENVQTGSRIWFNDLTILPGETITIDCNTQIITSNYGAGPTIDGVAGGGGRTFPGQPRRGSDFAGFRLDNSTNTINLFCARVPGSFVTATMLYRPRYDGIAAGEIP